MSFRAQPVAASDEARARVKELFCSRGVDVAEDSKNFDSLLRDRFAGEFRRERGTLVLAAQQGLPARLRRASAAAGPGQLLLAQLAETLRDDAGLDPTSARWAAETFAEILRPELLSSPAASAGHAAAGQAAAPPVSPAISWASSADSSHQRAAEVSPPTPPPPTIGAKHSNKPRLVFIAMLIAVGAIVLRFLSASDTHPASTSNPAPVTAPSRAPVVAAPVASARSLSPPIATGNCRSPNVADYDQMHTAIESFHQAAVQKNWALAERYENPSTYQGQVGFLNGYVHTGESTPTILKHDGCVVTVALRYKNNDDPQHYCIDEEYTMEYSGRWKIRYAKSVSTRTSC
jgi:hypothetical protein